MKLDDTLYRKIEEDIGFSNMDGVEKLLQMPRRDRGKSMGKIDTHTKGSIYQADLLRLPQDNGYNYALVVVDTYDRSIDAEPMKTTKSSEAVKAIKKIFSREYLKEPILMIQTDNGSEFKKDFYNYVKNDLKVILKYGKPYRSRQQALVERMNYVISKSIGRIQLAIEMNTNEISTEWVNFLPMIIKTLNENILRPNPRAEKTLPPQCRKNKGDCILLNEGQKVRIILEKPINTITEKREADSRWRITDTRWSNNIYTIEQIILRSGQPPFYRVNGINNAVYTRRQLQPVSDDEKPILPTTQIKYEIEKFLQRKKINNLIHYKIKWKNYPISQASWEARKNILQDIGKDNLKILEEEFFKA
jgi:transposase InsO family protein